MIANARTVTVARDRTRLTCGVDTVRPSQLAAKAERVLGGADRRALSSGVWAGPPEGDRDRDRDPDRDPDPDPLTARYRRVADVSAKRHNRRGEALLVPTVFRELRFLFYSNEAAELRHGR